MCILCTSVFACPITKKRNNTKLHPGKWLIFGRRSEGRLHVLRGRGRGFSQHNKSGTEKEETMEDRGYREGERVQHAKRKKSHGVCREPGQTRQRRDARNAIQKNVSKKF